MDRVPADAAGRTGHRLMGAREPVVPAMPPRVAKGGNGFSRWLGFTALRLAGWQVTGTLPDREKLLVIAAPHTSNWDWVIAILALWAMGLRMNYLIKDTALWWPASILIRATGGIPVNRAEPAGIADEVARRVVQSDSIIMVITPEGTRSRGAVEDGLPAYRRGGEPPGGAGVLGLSQSYHPPRARSDAHRRHRRRHRGDPSVLPAVHRP